MFLVFQGLDVFSNVAVETTVSGSIPSVPIGSEIEVDPFQEEITKVEKGTTIVKQMRYITYSEDIKFIYMYVLTFYLIKKEAQKGRSDLRRLIFSFRWFEKEAWFWF